ncbi:periplasmic protein [Candidatus Rubidus massiliensis]|nr:MAG: hypothetical protein BGO10_09485 [Chlamydia sp. 32-24]CDZ80707.1 periplasmic protein [Candidatus Rubidus massiliensis]
MKKLFICLSLLGLTLVSCENHSKSRENPQTVQQDRQVVGQVREIIIQDPSLSPTAKNVEIIAEEGVVTLRGQVNDSQEAKVIEEKVKRIPGVSKVKNELQSRNK